MDVKNKAALYARVSTTDKGQDVELQLKDLREYCRRIGYACEEYIDIGESGAKESRPSFDRMMSDAGMRRFDLVLVWKLDRLSRSLKHLISTLDFFHSKGIEFKCSQQNIDTTTPAGKLMFQLLGAFAEFERDLISERVKAGMANAKSKGIKVGRPGRDVNTEEICRLRSAGLSFARIAGQLNLSTGTVFRAFQKAGQNQATKPAPDSLEVPQKIHS